MIGTGVFNGCTQLSRLYIASSSITNNLYNAISNSKLTTNRAASCISLTYTTTPTQYTYGGNTWSLCYEPGQPTPSPSVSPTYAPSAVPTAAPTGNTVIIITIIFITIMTNAITITTSICMYIN